MKLIYLYNKWLLSVEDYILLPPETFIWLLRIYCHYNKFVLFNNLILLPFNNKDLGFSAF